LEITKIKTTVLRKIKSS